jgi:hypothetical protein
MADRVNAAVLPRHAAHACRIDSRAERGKPGPQDGTLPAMDDAMARSRAMEAEVQEGARTGTVRIEEECLELDMASPQAINLLRRWVGQVNGPAYPQPYLVEGPPGRFRLYVGAAAERVRTRHGIV